MLNHFALLLPLCDADVEYILNNQCTDETSPLCGTIADFATGYSEAWDGCRIAARLITAYYNKGAVRYRDSLLLERASLALDYALNRLNDDGSIDLMDCNFHDATANGFAMKDLGAAYLLMLRDTTHSDAEEALSRRCLAFTKASAEAMIHLGFHTPNHRWILSAGLSYCYTITGDESGLEHIKRFLAEGIDCDENGEYTERSAGVYNRACNRALLIVADQLNMPELREHVKRNLYHVMTYFEPDFTINTLNSTRQDMGQAIDYRLYYNNFLKMALMEEDGVFAYFADEMLKKILARFEDSRSRPWLPDMAFFLLHPEWEEKLPTITPVKPNLTYERLLEKSGILRWRKEDVTFTLIKGRPGFCQLQKGSHALMLRFAGSFFGKGQFAAQSLEAYEGGYRMKMHLDADYLRPFDQPPASPFWAEMDHSKRPRAALQTFDVTIDLKISSDSLIISLKSKSCERLPIKLEFILEPNALLDLGCAEMITRRGDYIYLKSGDCSYQYADGGKFTITSAFGKHHRGSAMRGTVGGEADRVTLAMTDFSPASHEITVKF